VKALRRLDLAVLGTVWMLCVLTDWSTGAKVALNVAAVALLCAKEAAAHRRLVRGQVPAPSPRLTLVGAAAG